MGPTETVFETKLVHNVLAEDMFHYVYKAELADGLKGAAPPSTSSGNGPS